MPSLYEDQLSSGVDTEWLAKNPAPNRDYGAMERLALGAGLAVPRAVQGLGETAATMLHWAGVPVTGEDARFLSPETQLPPGTTTGQSAADLASGLMPLAIELPLMGGPLQGIAGATGLAAHAPAITRALVQGGEFAGLAAQSGDAATTAEQFGEGGAAGYITAVMPRGIARTAAAAALGIGSKLFFDRNGGQKMIGDFSQGDIAGTALGLTTALLGKPIPKWTAPVVGEIPKAIPTPEPQVNYNLRNQIDARTGIINPGARTAADSAAAMKAAWGYDPNIVHPPVENLQSLQNLEDAKLQEINSAPLTEYSRLTSELNSIRDRIDNYRTDPSSKSAEESASFIQQTPRGILGVSPTHDLQALQMTSRQGMLAEQQGRANYMPSAGPDVPLLAIARADNPMVQITDLGRDQTLPQLLNRQPPFPIQRPSGMWVQGNPNVSAGGIEGPLHPPSPESVTGAIFNPANKQLVYDAAFGGLNPELLHQSQMTLQQLQTDWFARDVLQANRDQTHAFMGWSEDLQDRPTISKADPLTKLAASPHISVDDLATELRAYSPSERQAIGRELNVDPEDTRAMANALKEQHDPSLRPRPADPNALTDAQIYEMLHGEPNPNLSPRENEILQGMRRADPNRGTTNAPTLFAASRGLIGAGIGYAEGERENKSEGDKLLMALGFGAGALLAPPAIKALIHGIGGGEAETRIPQWGGRSETPRTHLSIDAPPRNTNNARFNETQDIVDHQIAKEESQQTLQRLQDETTRKGKVDSTPSWMRNEGGFSAPEMSAALGRASIGGLLGGTLGSYMDDPGSHKGMATGAIGGALLSLVGPAILKGLLAEHTNATIPETHSTPDVAKVLNTTAGADGFSLSDILMRTQNALSKANLAVNTKVLGREATLVDRALARFDYWAGTSLGPKFSRLLNQSSGPASYLTDRIDQAFHKLSFIDSDQSMRDLTSQYLNGDLPKEEYIKQMAKDSNSKSYADFATIAKDSMGGLKELIAKGVGNEKRAEMLRTTDNYLTRSYRMFVDKSYSPSVEATNKLAQKIYDTGAWDDNPNLDQIKSRLSQWVQEVQQSKGLYKPDTGKKIDQSAFGHRKDVSPEWKQFLGEITDPVDRIRLTVLKLKPMAEASNFLHQVVTGLTTSDEGLRFAFSSSGELEAAKAKALQSLQSNPSDPLLRKQLLELQQYKYIEQDARYGALQGQMVHRNVYDVVNEWGQSSKMDSAAGRALTGINQFMKSNVTYRNPMGIIRQALTTPFFLQVGRGFGGVSEAWDIMRTGLNHPMYKELMDNGILNVDSVTKDVLRDVDHLTNGALARSGDDAAHAFIGRIDHALAKAGAGGRLLDSKMADLFKLPDNFNRVAIYLAAKARAAESLGASLDSSEVINQAVEHTNRYSMNYSLLPKAVMLGRNVPFVNMFISYAAEMGRILKNLGEDLVNKDTSGDQRMNAVMSLATMIALPEAMQRLSESSLSDQDKKEWDRVKSNMPVYAKDAYYIVQGRDKATGKFRVYNISKLLPADQFQQTTRALTEGRIMDAAKNNPVVGWDNNPALNISTSFITGEDRITGRKLRGTPDYVATVAKEVGGPFAPGEGSFTRRFSLAHNTNADGTMGITDKRGRQITPADFWTDALSQVRANNIDPAVIDQGIKAQFKQDVANELAYSNDILKSNWPKEVKDKAILRTQEALKQIQDRFAQQMGLTK